MKNVVTFEGNDFVVNSFYAVESINLVGSKLMRMYPIISEKFGDRRVGIAFDFVRAGECSKETLVMWPTRYLNAEEEAILTDALLHNEVAEVEIHQAAMLDKNGQEVNVKRDEQGRAILTNKWAAWQSVDKSVNSGWHTPSGERVKFVQPENDNQ